MPKSWGAYGWVHIGLLANCSSGTSDARASVGLSRNKTGLVGKMTSAVAMSPLLLCSLVNTSGDPDLSTAMPVAPIACR